MRNNKVELKKNKDEIKDILLNVIDKGSNYVIKSMPVNKHIKDMLLNIKSCLGEQNFKDIVSTAIESSVQEGKEILGLRDKDIKEINKMVKIAFKGGLAKNLNIGVSTIENVQKYGNLFYNYIEDFFTSLKRYISSKSFEEKVQLAVDKCINKVNEFKNICSSWYKAYDNFDINNISNIADKLDKMKKKVGFSDKCVSQNAIIQNVTELVKQNNKKLTKTQFDICANLDQI